MALYQFKLASVYNSTNSHFDDESPRVLPSACHDVHFFNQLLVYEALNERDIVQISPDSCGVSVVSGCSIAA